MASTYQIGTAPDQIPTNGDLGEMAFQSKDNVNFTGRTGKLSKLDIEAINKQIGVTAQYVYVYDTSKDSDGGAWRYRTQNTSWYNETLNTATRGSRKDFPSVAVIIATTTAVYIHDGDDPSLPMWMAFTFPGYYTGGNLSGLPYGIGYNAGNGGISVYAVSCATMMNGQLFIGGNNQSGVHAGWQIRVRHRQPG